MRDSRTRRRPSRLERAVYEALESHPHASASEIGVILQRLGHQFNRNHLDRLLGTLLSEGAIRAVLTDRGRRFETRLDPHAHLRCYLCTAIEDVPFEARRYPAFFLAHAERRSFLVQDFHMDIWGFCSACRQNAPAERDIPTRYDGDLWSRRDYPHELPATVVFNVVRKARRNSYLRMYGRQELARLNEVIRAACPSTRVRRSKTHVYLGRNRLQFSQRAQKFIALLQGTSNDSAHARLVRYDRATWAEEVDVRHVVVPRPRKVEVHDCGFCQKQIRRVRLDPDVYRWPDLEIGHSRGCWWGETAEELLGPVLWSGVADPKDQQLPSVASAEIELPDELDK